MKENSKVIVGEMKSLYCSQSVSLCESHSDYTDDYSDDCPNYHSDHYDTCGCEHVSESYTDTYIH